MMTFNGLDITATRGDTTEFTIWIDENVPPDGTTALFTVKAQDDQTYTFLRKEFTVEDGEAVISLTAEETDAIPPGKHTWDIRWIYEDGRVFTPMRTAVFCCVEANGDV